MKATVQINLCRLDFEFMLRTLWICANLSESFV